MPCSTESLQKEGRALLRTALFSEAEHEPGEDKPAPEPEAADVADPEPAPARDAWGLDDVPRPHLVR